MLSIGIDSVDINRFKNWDKFNYKQLSKVFSNEEIEYCFSNKVKCLERLAARFAAKEALYKAITPLLVKKINFFVLCRNSSLEHSGMGNPEMIVNWDIIGEYVNTIPNVKCSITHTKNISTGIVVFV